MREETRKCALAFVHKLPAMGARTYSNGLSLVLHDSPIAQHVTFEGKVGIAFCLFGWASPVTLERLNGVTFFAFGQKMFCKRKGRVYFGPTNLREVEPHESLFIPIDFKPGDPVHAHLPYRRPEIIRPVD